MLLFAGKIYVEIDALELCFLKPHSKLGFIISQKWEHHWKVKKLNFLMVKFIFLRNNYSKRYDRVKEYGLLRARPLLHQT